MSGLDNAVHPRENGQGIIECDAVISVGEPWLEWLAASGRRPATVAVRRESLKRFVGFAATIGRTRCRDVTKQDLEDWRRAMFRAGNSASTVEQRLRSVRLLFDWLDEQGLLFENPARKLKLHRKPHGLPAVPSVAEMQRVLAGVNLSTPVGVRDRAIIETVYGGGLRLGEVAALATGDFDPGSGLLLVHGKGGTERAVPIGERAAKWLRTYLGDARPSLLGQHDDPGPFWIGICGDPLSRQGVAVRIRHWLREAGLLRHYSPHALRRAAATHMLDNGASPFSVQQFLGHSDMRHLGQYLRVSIRDVKRMHEKSRVGQ